MLPATWKNNAVLMTKDDMCNLWRYVNYFLILRFKTVSGFEFMVLKFLYCIKEIPCWAWRNAALAEGS